TFLLFFFFDDFLRGLEELGNQPKTGGFEKETLAPFSSGPSQIERNASAALPPVRELVERALDAERAGDVVRRAEAKNRERRPGALEGGDGLANRSVAAGDDDELGSVAGGAPVVGAFLDLEDDLVSGAFDLVANLFERETVAGVGIVQQRNFHGPAA